MFVDKSALDPLAEPDEIVPRTDQERTLGSILTGVTEGYLSTTVSVYGPPGTGKTITTRRLFGVDSMLRLCIEMKRRTSSPGFGSVKLSHEKCSTLLLANHRYDRNSH